MSTFRIVLSWLLGLTSLFFGVVFVFIPLGIMVKVFSIVMLLSGLLMLPVIKNKLKLQIRFRHLVIADIVGFSGIVYYGVILSEGYEGLSWSTIIVIGIIIYFFFGNNSKNQPSNKKSSRNQNVSSVKPRLNKSIMHVKETSGKRMKVFNEEGKLLSSRYLGTHEVLLGYNSEFIVTSLFDGKKLITYDGNFKKIAEKNMGTHERFKSCIGNVFTTVSVSELLTYDRNCRLKNRKNLGSF